LLDYAEISLMSLKKADWLGFTGCTTWSIGLVDI